MRISNSAPSVLPSIGISEYQGSVPDDGTCRIYVKNSILYYKDADGHVYRLLSEFKGWGYQIFPAGVINSTDLTITDNENGQVNFDSSKILSNSAVIVRASDPESFVYNGTFRLFSTKTIVNTHTGQNLTLSNIPHSSWGDLIVYYYYNYDNGIPNGYTLAPKSVSNSLFNELDNLFVTEEEWDTRLEEIISGIGTGGSSDQIPRLNILNRGMQALQTNVDGNKATAIPIGVTPLNDGHVQVFVNGVQKDLGDDTKECFFGIGDTSSVRQIQNIQSGDTLRWNGSIAKYQLDTNDRIDLNYVTY